ncbi:MULTISPECIES: DUF3617 domain-containing protein [unclassified Sphingomonas]|jgi:hypothetical protein|uniref:DUF3617 domain-containing protein n=1 Tax=unclassified Sphingomonas TaxID=196159 RepID=UPI00082F7245|nr:MULTISPECIES: DUF3617 domain-containing protein [unclassified Sphingomonas]
MTAARILIAPMILMLAACGGGSGGNSTVEQAAETGEVDLTNAAPGEVAKQAKASGAMRLNPGEWETTVEVVDIDIPGMPKGGPHSDVMKVMREAKTTVTNCVTPEEAENPESGVFTGSNGQCRYERFRMGGGRIDGTLACRGKDGGGDMRMSVNGTFSDTAFALDNAMETRMGDSVMKMRAKVSGKRIGACKG